MYDYGSFDTDPLTQLLRAEEEYSECDEIESRFESERCVSRTQKDSDRDDMLGASPAELAAQDFLH
jgi:hypothetical protein